MTVEAAVPAALENMQAARLPLQNYFGAREATIFSKHGSPRSGSHHGISFSSPYLTLLGGRTAMASCSQARSFSPTHAAITAKYLTRYWPTSASFSTGKSSI